MIVSMNDSDFCRGAIGIYRGSLILGHGVVAYFAG